MARLCVARRYESLRDWEDVDDDPTSGSVLAVLVIRVAGRTAPTAAASTAAGVTTVIRSGIYVSRVDQVELVGVVAVRRSE